ncbi:MAG: hypothetical protein C0609_05525 [Deltaproteobacteria bacterium]|nr:MAG: hypothetical protein C0609_05525 [Deltaproteobacteria bacterium]
MDKVTMGRVFKCPVCGAEVMVVGAASQELDPHCCNTSMLPKPRVHEVYHCAHCGAEVALVSGSAEHLDPYCCNDRMRRIA